MGESAVLTLCTIAETGGGLKCICFNTSLKITSGKKAHETHRLVNRRGGNDVFGLFFFRDPAIPARSWPGLMSMSSLIGCEWHHPPGRSSSHPDDVISAEACQWRNAGRAVTSSTPVLISFFSPLVVLFVSLLWSQLPRLKKKKRSFLHLFSSPQIQRGEMFPKAIKKLLKGSGKKNKEKWRQEHFHFS